jgi:hypothetical protein
LPGRSLGFDALNAPTNQQACCLPPNPGRRSNSNPDRSRAKQDQATHYSALFCSHGTPLFRGQTRACAPSRQSHMRIHSIQSLPNLIGAVHRASAIEILPVRSWPGAIDGSTAPMLVPCLVDVMRGSVDSIDRFSVCSACDWANVWLPERISDRTAKTECTRSRRENVLGNCFFLRFWYVVLRGSNSLTRRRPA